MGVYCDTDKAIERAKNVIGGTSRSIAQDMALQGMAYQFNDDFINGDPDVDPEEFKGLKKRIDDLVADDFAGQYIDNGGTAGDGVLHDAAERHNFIDSLHKLLYAIKGHKPDVLLMNSKCLLAINSALRRETGMLDSTKDAFDRRVERFYGVPMLDMGVKADQTTEIITNTETLEDDGGAESTSIYAVRFGIGQFLWGIQEYAIEVDDKGLLEDKPVYRTEIDWPLGLAMADPYSIARLYGIIPDSSD